MSLSIGCGQDKEATEQISYTASSVPEGLLVSSWIVRMSDDSQRAQFEGDPGWTAYFNREYSTAVQGMQGAGLARLHAEYASVYRQAALLHANATLHIYDKDRQEEDSVDSFYLRGVSKVLLGDLKGARSDFEMLTELELQEKSKQWLRFIEGDKGIIPNVIMLPELNGKIIPNPETLPHFTISTTIENEKVGVTDATELWARSVWHEEVAKSLVEDTSLIDLWMAPWVLPSEQLKVDKFPTLDDNWLFLSKYMTAEDLFFVYDLKDKKMDAITVWKEKSLLAASLSLCIVDGKVSPEKVLDVAADLEQQLLSKMKEQTGKELPLYSMFADFAEQGVLQAGMFLADVNEQSRDAGILRLNAKDLAQKNSNDVVFQISSAAWDIGNRYPLRAQDTIHYYSTEFPSLKGVKQPMDALQIRLGRNSAAPGAAN